MPLPRWKDLLLGSAADIGPAFGVFLLEVLLLQWLAGAYSNGFGAHPDESAHFISSLMVRDYIASLSYWHPLQFARTYYLHLPKVGIGNWPPVLYAFLGSWLLLFGASRAAALVFIAVTAAVLAAVIYRVGKKLIGAWAGWFAGGMYIALPLVQESSDRIMTEHLVTLFMLLAALRFAQFMRTERTRDGLSFGLLSSVAILTRGSAWALAMLPGLAILISFRFSLLKRAGLWASALPVLAVCIPWYALTLGISVGGWQGGSPGSTWFQSAMVAFLEIIFSSLGWALILPVALGVWAVAVYPARRRAVDVDWAVLAALAASTVLLLCLLPTGVEARYMVTAMPPLLLFAAAGLNWLAGRLPIRLNSSTLCAVLCLVVGAGFAWETFQLPTRYRNEGCEAVAKQLVRRFPVNPGAYMIIGDSIGEGSLIAAMSIEQEKAQDIVLRGSKIFTEEDWAGRGAIDRFKSPDKVKWLLAAIPVNVIVFDREIIPEERRAYHDRVRTCVVEDPATWECIGVFPAIRMNRARDDGIEVYARRSLLSGKAPSTLVNVALIKSLMQGSNAGAQFFRQ